MPRMTQFDYEAHCARYAAMKEKSKFKRAGIAEEVSGRTAKRGHCQHDTCGSIPQPAPLVKLEKDLHAQIENELKRRRWYYVHSRTDRATTQQLGVPDFIIAAPETIYDPCEPRTFWVEVKRKDGKLTKEQTITRHVLLSLKHNYSIVRSFKEFLEVIK